jgi:hypothetical protein
MLSMRTVMMTAAVVVAFSAGWLAKTSAQQNAPAPLITYFGHDKVDASFAQALASTGSTGPVRPQGSSGPRVDHSLQQPR